MIQRPMSEVINEMLTDAQYSELLTELSELRSSIVLEQDPLVAGLGDFNEKLARIQANRERTSSIWMDAIWNKTAASNKLQDAKNALEKASHIVLATNDVIAALRSADLRAAHIAYAQRDLVTQVEFAESAFSRAEAFLKSVQAVSQDLETKNDNLINQIKVAQAMISIHADVREQVRTSMVREKHA